MIKYSERNTKAELVEIITLEVMDEDRISADLEHKAIELTTKYGDNESSVTKQDMLELLDDMDVYIKSKQPNKKEDKPTVKADKPTVKAKTEPKDAEKPKAKPKAKPKKESKAESKKTPQKEPKLITTILPEEFEHSVLGKLVRVKHSEIKDIKDFAKAVESGRDLHIATYWNAKDIKDFDYNYWNAKRKPIKSFERDLDISMPIYITEEHTQIYMVSYFSESISTIREEDFESLEGVRYVNGGVEWEIYESKSSKK